MPSQKTPLPVFGGATVGSNITEPKDINELLQVLKDGGCHTIDTAAIYSNGKSEETFGEAGAGEGKWSFTIDTKAPGGFSAGSGTRENIAKQAKESLDRLKLKQVDVYYLHAPDDQIPLADTLAGVNDAYKAGYFKRFGLSNYNTDQVQKVYDHCKSEGYVLPSVFQGNYNAVARRIESDLFPLLRKLNMSFYAYSPSAGGVLSRSREELMEGGSGSGRFDESHPFGAMYRMLYNRKSILQGIDEWGAAAEAAGISRIELAYRWMNYHSALSGEHGDALIFGASKIPQAKSTLAWLNKGPLDDATVQKVEHIWQLVKDEAPLNNYDFVASKK